MCFTGWCCLEQCVEKDSEAEFELSREEGDICFQEEKGGSGVFKRFESPQKHRVNLG